jgi:hypothetical protein
MPYASSISEVDPDMQDLVGLSDEDHATKLQLDDIAPSAFPSTTPHARLSSTSAKLLVKYIC